MLNTSATPPMIISTLTTALNSMTHTNPPSPFCSSSGSWGKKDRAAAITQAQQQQRIDEFKSQAFLTRINGKEHFAGKSYNSYSHREQKWRQAMSDAIIQTYLDGYHGIK